MPLHVRKGDQVRVLSGKDRGKQGQVLRVDSKNERVLVEGVNVVKRHRKARSAQERSGIIEKELPIHISNVQPLVDGKPTRVRFETRPDGSKVRLASKSRGGAQLGIELRKAVKA